MTKFDRIRNLIRDYQKESDKLYTEYQAKEERAKKRYSKEVFETELKTVIWPASAGTALANANIAISEIGVIMEEIESDFRDFLMRPLKLEVLQTLNLINDFQIKPSLYELQVIEQSVKDSYFGTRVFAGLAKKAGYSVKSVDADTCIKQLQAAKSNIETAIRAYAGKGPDFPGRDLIDEQVRDGISYGEYTTWQLVYAANFLREGGEIDRLENLYNSIGTSMEYHLTPEENEKLQNKIDDIIEKGYGTIDKKKADELLREEPNIVSSLNSADDFPNKQIALDYFSPSGPENQKEETKKEESSKIDVASFAAKQYGTSLGKVNEKLLSEYK